MKKTGFYRLTALLSALLFCFVSCDSGTTDASSETTPTTETVSGIPDVGDVDLSSFSDELGDDDRLSLTQVYVFQPLPELEENWSYDSQQINTYDGMLCLTVRRQDKRRVIVERQVAVLDPDNGIVKRIPYTVPEVDHYGDDTLLEGILGMHMLDENTFLYTSYTNILHYTPDRKEELKPGYLMLCDAAGNVAAENTVPGVGRNRYITALPDGRIAVLGEESVCIYDRALNLLGQVSLLYSLLWFGLCVPLGRICGGLYALFHRPAEDPAGIRRKEEKSGML